VRRAALFLVLIGTVGMVAGCGSSGTKKPNPQANPQVVAERFMRNILGGYLDPAQADLSPVSGVDVRSLTNLSIGLQTGHFRAVGRPRKLKKSHTYRFTLAGELNDKPVHLVYQVGVAEDADGWRVVGFRLVKQARRNSA